MKYFEYGRENPELLVILHGGGVCYRGAAPTAKRLAEVYHVIIAAYDGFNPDEPETGLNRCGMKRKNSETTFRRTTAEK